MNFEEAQKILMKDAKYKKAYKRLEAKMKKELKKECKFIGVETTDGNRWCETHDKWEKPTQEKKECKCPLPSVYSKCPIHGWSEVVGVASQPAQTIKEPKCTQECTTLACRKTENYPISGFGAVNVDVTFKSLKKNVKNHGVVTILNAL